MNNGFVGKSLVGFGTDQQMAHCLPKLAGGSIAAFGLTEPDSGSDSAAMKTRAVRDGNGYVLNGTKSYITNAPFADVILVMASTNAEENGRAPCRAHVCT